MFLDHVHGEGKLEVRWRGGINYTEKESQIIPAQWLGLGAPNLKIYRKYKQVVCLNNTPGWKSFSASASGFSHSFFFFPLGNI